MVDSRHETQVAGAALLRLPEIRMFLCIGIDHGSVGQDDFPIGNIVAGKSMCVAMKRILQTVSDHLTLEASTYASTGGEAAHADDRRARTNHGDVVRIESLVDGPPARAGLCRGDSLLFIIGCRIHVAQVDGNAVLDAVGPLPGRVAARADTKWALTPVDGTCNRLHIGSRRGQNHAPGVLGSVGGVVGFELGVIDGAAGHKHLVAQRVLGRKIGTLYR